jgi:hypothetical protein
MTGYNHVCCIGSVSGGPWRNPGGEGKAESAAFGLAIPEPGKDGKVYTTFVRVECYGRVVSDALSLHAGDTVLCENKISWSKGSVEGKAQRAVTAWRVVPLASKLSMTG